MSFDYLKPPDNSIMFNNSLRIDDSNNIFNMYNSLDFNFNRPDTLFGNNSLSHLHLPSPNNNLQAIRESIQMVETEAKVDDENSFKKVRAGEEVIIVPIIKKKVKL